MCQAGVYFAALMPIYEAGTGFFNLVSICAEVVSISAELVTISVNLVAIYEAGYCFLNLVYGWCMAGV